MCHSLDLPSLNTGRHLLETKKATKSIQKVKTFQVDWFHFQTAFSAKLSSAIYHQNYTVLPCLPLSLWVPLQPSQTDLVLHRRTVGVLRQIPTRAINQVGRQEISAECQNMIAIKHPEEKCRCADPLHFSWIVKSCMHFRWGLEQGGETEVIGDADCKIPSLQDQLPPLHILRANCSHQSPESSPYSSRWKSYNKGKCQSWSHCWGKRQELS